MFKKTLLAAAAAIALSATAASAATTYGIGTEYPGVTPEVTFRIDTCTANQSVVVERIVRDANHNIVNNLTFHVALHNHFSASNPATPPDPTYWAMADTTDANCNTTFKKGWK